MLRAARVARGSHPATPASKPAPLRGPSPTARLPAVLRAAPSSLGPLSVTSARPSSAAAQLALSMLSARLARRLWGRESLDHLAVRGVRSLALRPRASLGDGISRSLFCADQLPRRGFSSGPPQPTVREFNPNGSMRPESTRLFYFVSPDTRTLMKHIEVQDPNSRYVILYGPSQSGKTTRMFYFMRQLATIDPNYLPVFVDMSTLKNVTSQALWAAMTLELPAGEPVPCIHDENEFLKWVLSVHERGKKLVLFFDEADAFLMYAPKETRSNFLTTLRAAKAYRNGPAAAFLIGRFLVTEGHTEIGSPFNVTRSYETPLFNKEDMKELFGQFEADMRVKWNSNFQVDPAILDDIMAMTNGHPGLVNLCGRILAERVNRVHHAPSLEEWRDLMPFSTALQSYIKTANGQRMTHTLKSNSTALSLGLQLLRSQSVRVRDLPGDKDRTLEAAKQLVQEGIATFTDPTQKHIKLLCPINAALVRNVASTLYAASPPSLVNAQALTVPVLLRAMLPWLPGEILSHDLTRHKTNLTSSGHPTRGQRESVFRVQIGAQLTTLFENTSYKLVDDLPTSDGASRSIYPDIVICRDNEPLFVLELAVNMNLTWTLSPGKEMQKATLWYHLDKTAKYLERLKPREAWVVHFTTVPPSQFPGGKYPRSVYVPGAEHVQLMHVHYDEAWTQATMHLPDGTQDTFSLLPAPLSLAPFELESFLRDEAKIDADGVKEYVPLLRKNKVDEAGLHLLTDAMLRSWGIEAGLDRAKILAAAQKRTTGGQR